MNTIVGFDFFFEGSGDIDNITFELAPLHHISKVRTRNSFFRYSWVNDYLYTAFSPEWLAQDSSWVVDSSGTPWVSNGVTHDAAKALDGVAGTYWNPVGTDRHSARHIVLDLKEPHTLTRIALNNFGNTVHDIKAFKLQKSTLWSPFHWEDVVSVTDVEVGTDRRQEFGGFKATARYWRFLITETSEGWQPRLRELNLYGELSPRNPSPGKARPFH